ncbi:hypothetical protein [Candidatus Epulonipiscium viviparus]|uniref:hypothetical protein n=1 Tax=Candidatus Epulonipiscium viviparus TaxID=420336 RepID=UPI0012EACB8C|nr:hypothetical protein [Candidatus Epulopiscium viviparus]
MVIYILIIAVAGTSDNFTVQITADFAAVKVILEANYVATTGVSGDENFSVKVIL